MRRLVALLIAASILMAVAASPAAAKKGGTDRPLKGTIAGTTVVTPVSSTSFTSASTATGNVSHLGKTSGATTASQDWSGYTPTEPCADVAGTIVLTAANGNTVVGTINTALSQTCESGSAYASTLVVDVVGGTGRFSGATGRYVITGLSTPTATLGTYSDAATLAGSISY